MARTSTPSSGEIADQVAASSRRPIEPAKRTIREWRTEDLCPSGSTLLNLACTDNPYGAYMLGGIVTIPGASGSGKTILGLTTLAEAHQLPRFDEYDLIHDDAEERRAFDMNYLFGASVANRIIEPFHGNSPTIQKFDHNMTHLLKASTPFIYFLDSLDSLSSDEELEKAMRRELAACKSDEAAKKIAGSYNTEKAKILGELLRRINNSIKDTKSLLVILQQRRQKINEGGMPAFGDKWTTSGGEAPFYYSNHQVWMNKVQAITRQKRQVGTTANAKLKKNSATGKLRDATFDIYYDYGVDDLGSCVDFLLEEGYWKKSTTKGDTDKIKAEELDILANRTNLIARIEEEKLQDPLRRIVAKAWREIEENIRTDRKPRYE